MESKGLYNILDIPEDASMRDIRKAYLKKSKELHPDKGGSEEEFQELSEAYRVLSDPTFRKMYDEGCQPEALKEETDGLMRRVFSVFEEALGSYGFVPDHTDLFKLMRGLCNDKEQKMESNIEKIEGEIRNVEAIQARMKNADIFVSYLENVKEDKTDMIKKIVDEKEYITRILNFIENFEYEVEEDDDEDYKREREKTFGATFGADFV